MKVFRLDSLLCRACLLGVLVPGLLTAPLAQKSQGNINPNTPNPVTIGFDELGVNTNVTNQYPQVTFSAIGFSGGWDNCRYIVTQYPSLGGSTMIASYNSTYFCLPGTFAGDGRVYMDFPLPVNNPRFHILGATPYSTGGYPDFVCSMAVYVNRSYYGYFDIYQNFPGPIFVDLGNLSNVTGIALYNCNNYSYSLNQIFPLYYDDLTFTPTFDIGIYNVRVSGDLAGTTQKALLGARVNLSSSLSPGAPTGGTYSWTFTGQQQPTIVAGNTSLSDLAVRWTQPGTYTAKVTYTKNGLSASAIVTVNVILPTLSSYSATQVGARLARNECAITIPPTETIYILGCPIDEENGKGIVYSATTTIPPGPYISDLSESGVKFVQLISYLRKRVGIGGIACSTARLSENDINSGWRIDGPDPYAGAYAIVVRFSEGVTSSQGITVNARESDTPSATLGRPNFVFATDMLKLDERFETYLVYFTGMNPAQPDFQTAMGYPISPTNNKPVARIEWQWGGEIRFDFYANNYEYTILSDITTQGVIPARPVEFMRPYSMAADFILRQCPNGPAPSLLAMDSSHFFIRELYRGLLQSEPDTAGWKFWSHQIASCGFDLDCVNQYGGKRHQVATIFFNHERHTNRYPPLANPPGTPNFDRTAYNYNFVLACYESFLRRTPSSGEVQYWLDALTNSGDDYPALLYTFITCPEFRQLRGSFTELSLPDSQ
jgi:hypothetical protein